MRLQRRFSNGLAFTTSFTYSSAKGNFLDHLSAGGGATGNFPLNRYDIAADYGPLPFDIPKRFVASFIYELPVGKSHAFDPGGITGAILRDWSVNGILTLSDGRPFSVSATDRAGTGSGRTTRANCVADPAPDGFDQSIDHWMDINSFAQLATGHLWELSVQQRARSWIQVVERVAVPQLPVGRPARRVPARDLQSVQQRQLQLPRGERQHAGELREDHEHDRQSARDAVGGQVVFLTLAAESDSCRST